MIPANGGRCQRVHRPALGFRGESQHGARPAAESTTPFPGRHGRPGKTTKPHAWYGLGLQDWQRDSKTGNESNPVAALREYQAKVDLPKSQTTQDFAVAAEGTETKGKK